MSTQLVKQIGMTFLAKNQDGTELPIKFNPVLNKGGKATKLVAPFAPTAEGEGDGSARALKVFFKAQNPDWSHKDIREAVQKSLRNGENVRTVAALALHGALLKAGALPDYSQMNLKGDHCAIHYTMAGKEPATSSEKKLSKTEAALEAQKKENEAMLARVVAAEEANAKLAAQVALLLSSSVTPSAAPAA